MRTIYGLGRPFGSGNRKNILCASVVLPFYDLNRRGTFKVLELSPTTTLFGGWENSKKHCYCRSKSTLDLPPTTYYAKDCLTTPSRSRVAVWGGGGGLGSCHILSCPGFQGYGLYCTGYINLIPSQIEGSCLAIIK